MISTLTIENFRCFRSLTIDHLKRINVVVGENGSGKTSLFEAIFLAAAGHPIIALRVRGWRGLGEITTFALQRDEYENVWKGFFNDLDQTRVIDISLQGTPETTRQVRIFYSSEGEEVRLPLGQEAEDSTVIVPIVFEYHESPTKIHRFEAQIGPDGLTFKGAAQSMRVSYFSSAVRASVQETAKRFSDLRKRKEERKFISLFH